MGSASVFFYKHKSDTSILNDINGKLVNLMVQVRDNLDMMINWIWNTPFSEEMHKKISFAFQELRLWNSVPKVKQAAGYFYLLQLAFNDSIGSLASPSYKISTGRQKWNQELCKLIYDCSRKLNHTIIFHRNYRELIADKAVNTKESFWYLDPPYTMADDKSYYSDNFGPDSHRELYNSMKLVIGDWLMSYDDSPIIRDIYKEFHIYKLKDFTNEIIITNYKIIKQEGIFGEDYLI